MNEIDCKKESVEMRFIRKFAEFVGCRIYHSERFNEWRCPNKKCGMQVLEDYICCPYCGQKLKFRASRKEKRAAGEPERYRGDT